jgi:hypothetical protein
MSLSSTRGTLKFLSLKLKFVLRGTWKNQLYRLPESASDSALFCAAMRNCSLHYTYLANGGMLLPDLTYLGRASSDVCR